MKDKKIHFVGIKGVGMAPLAIIAKEAGFDVTGSDIADVFITDDALTKARITSWEGFAKEHVAGADLVITTGAHGGFDNREVVAARELGIEVWTQGEAVGKFMEGSIFDRNFTGISVLGAHGKTTTTAMISTIFMQLHQDPSFLIGTSAVASLKTPGHYGQGKYFIAEADEYATEPHYNKTPKFLWQHPDIAVITNIEHDHPDIYPSLAAVKEAYQQFLKQMNTDGLVIAYGDDENIQDVLSSFQGEVITYGYNNTNTYVIHDLQSNGLQAMCVVEKEGRPVASLTLQVVGEHNILNATAAFLVALTEGFDKKSIQDALYLFTGSKRRFEYKGTLVNGALLYDDYAHHPTEIQKTLRAFKQAFPDKKIVSVFQPHTYSRTKSLFEQFITSFSDADTVIIVDIYPSLREKPDKTISSEQIVADMKNNHSDVQYLSKISDVVEYIDKNQFGEDTVIVTMGAGDIYTLSEHVVKKDEA